MQGGKAVFPRNLYCVSQNPEAQRRQRLRCCFLTTRIQKDIPHQDGVSQPLGCTSLGLNDPFTGVT